MRKILLALLFVFFSSNCLASSEMSCSWIDFPKQTISFHLGYHDQSFDSVNALITQYHELDKLDENNLSNRSKLLIEISISLDKIAIKIQDSKKSEALTKLSLIARKKAEYLNKLSYIFNNKLDSYETMHGLYATNKHDMNGLLALPLVNNVIYAANLPSYWGLYWLEALDPCHRMLTPYYVKWKEQKEKIPFFMWLEGQEIPYYIFQIELFNSEKLIQLQYSISPQDGLLYNVEGQKPTLNKENEEYIYVITVDKKILIAKGSQTVRHFSLSEGYPVFASGSIKIHEGKITYIDGESGHYQPTIVHVKQSINILKTLGAKLDKDVGIKYYHEKKAIKVSLGQFLEESQYASSIIDPKEKYISDFTLR